MTREEAKKRLEVWLKCRNCPENKVCYDRHLNIVCEDYKFIENISLYEAIKVAISALSVPEREKGEMRAIDEAQVIIKAFKSSLESINGRLKELEHESELLELDLQDGVKGYGMQRKCFEVRVKKELLRDILCFMTQALEEAKEGSNE